MDGDTFAFVITDTNAPIKDPIVRLTVWERGTKSVIIIQAQYKPKLGILGAVMNVLILKHQLSKNLAAILNDFRTAVERDEGSARAA